MPSPSFASRAERRRCALLLVVLLASCEHAPTAPVPATATAPRPAPEQPVLAALTCRGGRAIPVSCVPAQPSLTGANALIIGGQGTYVSLAAGAHTYDGGSGQYSFGVTVQNLIQQPLGTVDGSTLDASGVRVYFHSGPVVTDGAGTVGVVPDGFATNTAAGQAYYQYNQVLAQGVTSAPRTWMLIVPPTVNTFSFTLYVAAAVQHPTGYIEVSTPSTLYPAAQQVLTAVRRTAVGNVAAGSPTLVWSTGDASIALVTQGGTVTGVRAGTGQVSVTDGVHTTVVNVPVTGATRTWSGAVSSAWDEPGNWNAIGPAAPAMPPVAADSADIPAGAPNMPALTGAAALASLTVQDGAIISLGTFDLTLSATVITQGLVPMSSVGGLLRLTGSACELRGRLAAVWVTGTCTLTGDAWTPDFTLVNGSLTDTGFTLTVEPL